MSDYLNVNSLLRKTLNHKRVFVNEVGGESDFRNAGAIFSTTVYEQSRSSSCPLYCPFWFMQLVRAGERVDPLT